MHLLLKGLSVAAEAYFDLCAVLGGKNMIYLERELPRAGKGLEVLAGG